MRKYSEAGARQEMHDVKEVVIQPPWLHLTLVIVIMICDDDDDDDHDDDDDDDDDDDAHIK